MRVLLVFDSLHNFHLTRARDKPSVCLRIFRSAEQHCKLKHCSILDSPLFSISDRHKDGENYTIRIVIFQAWLTEISTYSIHEILPRSASRWLLSRDLERKSFKRVLSASLSLKTKTLMLWSWKKNYRVEAT